ncbi:MAG: ribosome recycling factor [Bacillota bacterium]|nr:ribosome recycling factor [Bacillota bacterium]
MKNEYQVALEERIEKTMNFLKEELVHIRAGRANPLLLDRVTMSYYGAETPIKQLASISVPEPRIIQVQPYDASVIRDLERALQAANLGINPSSDGKVIRLVVPMLTEERRVELTKQVKKLGEDAKVAIRNERRDAIEGVKKQEKNKEITEDDRTGFEKDIQKVVDDAIAKVDAVIADKNKEIMEV